MLLLLSSSLMMSAARSSGRTPFRMPPYFPMGVLTASSTTASGRPFNHSTREERRLLSSSLKGKKFGRPRSRREDIRDSRGEGIDLQRTAEECARGEATEHKTRSRRAGEGRAGHKARSRWEVHLGRREVRDSEIKLRSANPDVSGGPHAGPGVERSLFKHSDFLKFWSADSISFFGSQFSLLAIPWVAVTTLGADASQMGILGALSLLAFPLFGLFVGVWVDRNLRKRTMIVSNLGRALLLATIPAATILGGLSMNLLSP